ncbi:MAG: DUF3786 domain-containing protein [Dethiobacteria bacterium]
MEKKRSYFNLEETLRQVVGQFSNLDAAEVADKAGAHFDAGENIITLDFLSERYSVHHPDGKVTNPEGDSASLYLAIIILHYLVTSKGTPLTGKWITYRYLPGGDIYIEPFQKRAIAPFLKTFGDDPEGFKKTALALGGKEIDQSGVSMVIPVLPRVPICFTVWPGDDEMPASANILFDEAAPNYLPTEDYAHLPAIVNGALKSKL